LHKDKKPDIKRTFVNQAVKVRSKEEVVGKKEISFVSFLGPIKQW